MAPHPYPALSPTKIIENLHDIDEIAVGTPENGVVVPFDEAADSRTEGISSTVGVGITSTRHKPIVLSFLMHFEGERPPTQYEYRDATSTGAHSSLNLLTTAATLLPSYYCAPTYCALIPRFHAPIHRAVFHYHCAASTN